MMMFGYPPNCTSCSEVVKQKIDPWYRPGGEFRLMLIGQDPTIRKDPERVTNVLMLNEDNSQLSRWLRGLFGEENFKRVTIYATNLVKCRLPKVPTEEGGIKYLKPYFEKCSKHLVEEVVSYKPSLVMTLGEPAHMLFRTLLQDKDSVPESMQGAFSGQFWQVKLEGKEVEFKYTPCLHIQTFRVAETYGDSVKSFKASLLEHLRIG